VFSEIGFVPKKVFTFMQGRRAPWVGAQWAQAQCVP